MVVSISDKFAENADDSFLAIKKIMKAFEHKIYARRLLRELKVMRLLTHENVISIDHILLPESRENFEDVYILFEIMQTDLD